MTPERMRDHRELLRWRAWAETHQQPAAAELFARVAGYLLEEPKLVTRCMRCHEPRGYPPRPCKKCQRLFTPYRFNGEHCKRCVRKYPPKATNITRVFSNAKSP